MVPIAIGGTNDHVHLLIQLKLVIDIPSLVNYTKVNSTTFSKSQGILDFAWQKGYGAYAVDVISYDRLKNYIQRQEEHHHTMTSKEEEQKILKRYKIPQRSR